MTNKVIKFHEDLKVINIGLEGFAQDLKQQDVKVVEVDWCPPADGQENLIKILKNIDSFLRIRKNYFHQMKFLNSLMNRMNKKLNKLKKQASLLTN